jgi:hypothetical protein
MPVFRNPVGVSGGSHHDTLRGMIGFSNVANICALIG